MNLRCFISGIVLLCVAGTLSAQTTTFTYQGNLNSDGTPASGNHDFEFALFISGGSQIGPTLTRTNVPVTNGIFAVELDFGNNYTGVNRELEVRIRPSGGGAFTTLMPRQLLRATPYSIVAVSSLNSLNSTNAVNATNASQLGGIAANQFVQTTDPRMTDARNPLPNSTSYIQNRNTQQAASNFNISGTGSATVFRATEGYNIGVNRILSAAGTGNTIVGLGTAAGNSGTFNSFFGFNAGFDAATGGGNSFFGASAGSSNTTGTGNSFFGFDAGIANTGNGNSFFGGNAGDANTTGSNNTIIGTGGDVAAGNLNFATAIGADSTVSASNTIALGRSSGADTVLVPGTLNAAILSAPRLTVSANSGNILMGDAGCSPGFLAIGFVASFIACTNYSLLGNGTDTILNRPAGGRLFFRENNSTQMTLAPGGSLGLGTASPTERLHVVGNSFVTGSSTIGSSLTVNGSLTFGGVLSSGSNANFGGSLFAGGAVNTSAHFRINGNQVLTRSRLDLFNTAAVPRGFSFEVLNSPSFLVLRNDLGSTIMTVMPDGNVGIGTNSPTAATLEIGGTLAVSNLGGSNGDHLCRDGNVIRACSGAAENTPGHYGSSAAKIVTLESMVRAQQVEIDRQRNELEALKNFICSQNLTAELCGPKQR